MNVLDIILVNVISFLGGTFTGLSIAYKFGCSRKSESPPTDLAPISYSSSGTFPQEPVLASAPQRDTMAREIIIKQ